MLDESGSRLSSLRQHEAVNRSLPGLVVHRQLEAIRKERLQHHSLLLHSRIAFCCGLNIEPLHIHPFRSSGYEASLSRRKTIRGLHQFSERLVGGREETRLPKIQDAREGNAGADFAPGCIRLDGDNIECQLPSIGCGRLSWGGLGAEAGSEQHAWKNRHREGRNSSCRQKESSAFSVVSHTKASVWRRLLDVVDDEDIDRASF